MTLLAVLVEQRVGAAHGDIYMVHRVAALVAQLQRQRHALPLQQRQLKGPIRRHYCCQRAGTAGHGRGWQWRSCARGGLQTVNPWSAGDSIGSQDEMQLSKEQEQQLPCVGKGSSERWWPPGSSQAAACHRYWALFKMALVVGMAPVALYPGLIHGIAVEMLRSQSRGNKSSPPAAGDAAMGVSASHRGGVRGCQQAGHGEAQ